MSVFHFTEIHSTLIWLYEERSVTYDWTVIIHDNMFQTYVPFSVLVKNGYSGVSAYNKFATSLN